MVEAHKIVANLDCQWRRWHEDWKENMIIEFHEQNKYLVENKI
jgi:hypothetical protein